jgi:hypothetical protein
VLLSAFSDAKATFPAGKSPFFTLNRPAGHFSDIPKGYESESGHPNHTKDIWNGTLYCEQKFHLDSLEIVQVRRDPVLVAFLSPLAWKAIRVVTTRPGFGCIPFASGLESNQSRDYDACGAYFLWIQSLGDACRGGTHAVVPNNAQADSWTGFVDQYKAESTASSLNYLVRPFHVWSPLYRGKMAASISRQVPLTLLARSY